MNKREDISIVDKEVECNKSSYILRVVKNEYALIK